MLSGGLCSAEKVRHIGPSVHVILVCKDLPIREGRVPVSSVTYFTIIITIRNIISWNCYIIWFKHNLYGTRKKSPGNVVHIVFPVHMYQLASILRRLVNPLTTMANMFHSPVLAALTVSVGEFCSNILYSPRYNNKKKTNLQLVWQIVL